MSKSLKMRVPRGRITIRKARELLPGVINKFWFISPSESKEKAQNLRKRINWEAKKRCKQLSEEGFAISKRTIGYFIVIYRSERKL